MELHGCYVMPGMIDIHSDMIESYIQPRSTAIMSFEMGLKGGGAGSGRMRDYDNVSLDLHVPGRDMGCKGDPSGAPGEETGRL